MKRILILITALISLFMFAACGEQKEPTSAENNSSQFSEASESLPPESQSSDLSESSEPSDSSETDVQTQIDYTAHYVRSFKAEKINVYPFAATVNTKGELDAMLDAYSHEKVYDESFFESKSLTLIFLEEGSGSIKHTVKEVSNNENGWIFVDIDTEVPEICTADMAYWCIMIETSKDDARNNISLCIYDKTLKYEDDTASSEENFSFSFTWNTYGVSSYDSATGKLIKTTDTQTPEKYTTYYKLTELQRKQLYALIINLDVLSYPDEYDPNPTMGKDPPSKIILSVKTKDFEKTITVENDVGEPIDTKAAYFCDACRIIRGTLMQTEEWKALPDYEHYYE